MRASFGCGTQVSGVGVWITVGAVFCLVAVLGGCVGVPREAVELSRELGGRIGAMEAAHRRLIGDYFDKEKAEVGRFVDQRWGPAMAEEFFADPVIAGVWEEVAASGSVEGRRRFVLETAPKLAGAVEAKKRELKGPIEELERAVTEGIGSEYGRMREMNAAVTGLLDSAAAVEELSRGLWEKVGLSESRVDEILSKTGRAVEGLAGAGDAAADVAGSVEAFKKKIEAMVEEVK